METQINLDDDQPVRFLDHPKVKELAQMAAELQRQMDELSALVEPSLKAMREAEQIQKSTKSDFDDIRRQFEEKMAAEARTTAELARTVRNINSGMQDFRYQKMQMDRKLRDMLDELLATQQLLDQEEKWNEFLTDSNWLWIEKAHPFQMRGIKFMAGARDQGLHGKLNADQMGLGKTLQAVATLDLLQAEDAVMREMPVPQDRAVLWLCPNTIKDTTVLELRKWSPKRPVGKLSGPPALRAEMVKLAYDNGMTLVCNYETLRNTPELMWEKFETNARGGMEGEPIPRHWPIVVLDEAHKFKNDGSQLFTFVERLCENAGLVYPMTGTPLMNRPEEFWAILHMLTLQGRNKGKFEYKDRFVNEYCWKFGSTPEFRPNAAEELMKNVKDMVIRRRKDEVLTELPAKVGGITRWRENPGENIRYVELTGEQKSLYENMRDRFFVWLDEQTRSALTAPVVIAQFTRLRQIALYPMGVKIPGDPEAGTIDQTLNCAESAKFDECMNILDELDPSSGEQVLIFTSYEDEVINALKHRIMERFPDIEVGRITGKESSEKKALAQSRFNDKDDNMRVIIGTTRAMGIGLNLQANCSNAIFLDLDWNPGMVEQAEDRLHRQGQTNSVNIITIQAENTIDGYIMRKLMKKMDMISGTIERDELRQARDEGLI